jgi:hypothetical protein
MPIPTRNHLLEFVEQIAGIRLPSEGRTPEEDETDALYTLILGARDLVGEPGVCPYCQRRHPRDGNCGPSEDR